jgi:hypothetical protein
MTRRLTSLLFTCLTVVAAIIPGLSLAEQTDELAGEWVLTIDTPRGIQNPTMVINLDGGNYTGVYSSRRGPINIESISRDGNRFSFPLTITVPIGDIQVNYRGEFAGDEMTGEVTNPRGTVPFTGKRKTADAN